MNTCNHIRDIAAAIFSACNVDLPDIEYRGYVSMEERQQGKAGPLLTRRPTEHDIDSVEQFQQTWGSTALGFGGIGGASMTTATTTIIRYRNWIVVYFGGRFAYKVQNPSRQMLDDIRNQSMAKVGKTGLYHT